MRLFSILAAYLLFSSQVQISSPSLLSKVKGLYEHIVSYFISSDPNDVKFYLYPNPKNIKDADELVYGKKASLKSSRLNPDNAYTFLMHGFTQNHTSPFPKIIKDAYLYNGFAPQLNIIAVDWSKLTPDPSVLTAWPAYVESSENVAVVGKRVAQFIQFLSHNGYLPGGGDRVHLIGFSLGAHCAGMAGRYFREFSETLVYRITGLDPAGPAFQDAGTPNRLDYSDAQFVDIVHTNAEEFGYNGDLGDVDFYVNGGGPIQPFCIAKQKENGTIVENVKTVSGCSHNSAVVYYALSIGNKTMKACPGHWKKDTVNCTSSDRVVFGENCPYGAKGEYYIQI